MRLLVKFGYLGWMFTGFQRGNGERSVEDSILRVLRSEGLAQDIHCAARTDRGVSALSNALALDSNERPAKILGILNSSIPDMLFHSYAMVEDDFNPRHCDYKIYRYIIPRSDAGPYLRNSLRKFRGRHDFRNFCRMDERNPIRTIQSIRTRNAGDMVHVDFRSRSFLWNQIRTMMAYSLDHSFQEETPDPFSITERYQRMADPESLVFYDIFYPGVEFSEFASRSKLKVIGAQNRRSSIRSKVLQSFTDNFVQ